MNPLLETCCATKAPRRFRAGRRRQYRGDGRTTRSRSARSVKFHNGKGSTQGRRRFDRALQGGCVARLVVAIDKTDPVDRTRSRCG